MKATVIHNGTTLKHSEFAVMLDAQGINYLPEGPFLFHGNASYDRCWLLYISLTELDFRKNANEILTLLAQRKIAFRIPKDTISLYRINTGELGNSTIGRVITIYAEDDRTAAGLASELVVITEDSKGITVPDAIHIGGRVYAAFSEQSGKASDIIKLSLPKNHPFNKNVSYPASPKRFIGKGYIPANIIKTGPKGDVMQAVNVRRFAFNWCLIKQGKAYAADDQYGRDIRHRLLWQRDVLNQLVGVVPVPKVIDCLETDGDTYLVTEFVEGQLLTERCRELLAGKPYSEVTPEAKLAFLALFQQVTAILVQLHGSGIVHRDITGGNLIVDKKGGIKLIDFELAYDLTKNEPNPPFVRGTIGYVAPEQARYATPTNKEDIYAFGSLLYHCITGQHPKDALLETKRESINRLPVYCTLALQALVRKLLNDNPSERPDISGIQQALGNEIRSVTSNPLERKRKTFPHIIVIESIIGMIFLYLIITGGSKLFNLQQFGYDMNAQPIAQWIKPLLAKGIPFAHIGLGVLLFHEKTRLYALIGISILIMGYLLYIAAIHRDFFAFQPCSCTWVYKHMRYEQTFALNLNMGILAAYLLTAQFFGWMAGRLNSLKRNRLQKRKEKWYSDGIIQKM